MDDGFAPLAQALYERDDARAEVERLRQLLKDALQAIIDEPNWAKRWAYETLDKENLTQPVSP